MRGFARPRRLGGLGACILGLTLGAAAPGRAATVSLRAPDSAHGSQFVAYQGSPGERNRLTVTRAGSSLRLTEAGAVLTAGESCHAIDSHTASCRTNGAAGGVDIDLGDGDDRASVDLSGLAVLVEGGDGNDRVRLVGATHSPQIEGDAGSDRLTGSVGRDRLYGGPGDDRLSGRGGNDWILGGDGDDHLWGGAGGDHMSGDGDFAPSSSVPGGDDVIVGGPGRNWLQYFDHTVPVSVDLERHVATSSGGERDRISGFHAVDGGQAADDIRGTPGRDHLIGGNLPADGSSGPGGDLRRNADTLIGRGGDDRLRAGTRGSKLIGGPGADYLRDWSYGPVHLDCGRGRDIYRVDTGPATPNAVSLVPRSCEGVSIADFLVTLLRVSAREIVFHEVPIYRHAVARHLTVSARGVRYGSVRWRARQRGLVLVHLDLAGRRAVRAHRVVTVNADGDKWRLRL